jgi:5-amino-6-(5-phosphoribosylamino)uracil reductase
MTADGKIGNTRREAARFSSINDKKHLEKQISLADGVLFGAGTLRSYGTTLPICDTQLLQRRKEQGKPPQPIQIVCSASGMIAGVLGFFSQPVPRWLLTTVTGAKLWKKGKDFERILVAGEESQIDWNRALIQIEDRGIKNLAVLGGGELVASLLAEDLVDELWLTICPIILGGATAPTPVEGEGLLIPKKLELISLSRLEQEVFLHYRRVYSY